MIALETSMSLGEAGRDSNSQLQPLCQPPFPDRPPKRMEITELEVDIDDLWVRYRYPVCCLTRVQLTCVHSKAGQIT